MSGFFSKLKDTFTQKEVPKFKIYEPSQLKMIVMRTRVVLQTKMTQNLKQITSNDQQFKYVGQDPSKIYNILQLIGQKVMEVQTMKILIEMMRKVQNLSPQIVKTNGDIALMRKELIWFQCVLWFRKTRQIDNLQELNKFCWDFFKGADITTQLDLKCEVFQIYPVLKFLKKGEVLPLREILFYIQPYVSCNIQQNTLDSVFRINTEEIKKKVEDSPINKHKYGSTIPQNQGNYSQIKNNNYIPQNQTSYSNIKPQSSIYTPYSPPIGDNKQYNVNPYDSSAWIKQQNNQSYPNTNPNYHNPNNFYNNNQRQQSQTMPEYNQNYNNFNHPHPQQNPISNSNPYGQNNNAYNRPQTYNIPPSNPNNSLNVNPNLNRNIFQENQQAQNIVKPEPTKPLQQKPSFYNSLLRVNSNSQNDKQPQPKIEPKPLNINVDNKRQAQNEYPQQFQSAIPFINQNKDALSEDAFQKQMRQLQLMQIKNNLLVQEEIKRKENERKQAQLRLKRQRQQQERQQLQAERLRLEQIKIQLQQQSKKRQQQHQRRREEQERRREEQQRQRQEQFKHRIQQQKRKQRQEEQRREREEQQRQRQYQARRLQRQREERESSEIELNVFADNQREEGDRGLSGRFSSTFGMKIDFGQDPGEQFNFQSPHEVKSSILRFSKIKEENQQYSEQKQAEINLVEQDEEQSLNIIKQFSEKNTPSNFKLFYFKAMQASQ